MKTKTKIFLAIIFTLSCKCFALPGVQQYIADTSGEYVYYRDHTFLRESYVGFLFYDESTYAARYFAPVDKKNKLPAEDVIIYFTVKPDSDHFEFTGEVVDKRITPEQTTFVNYLHDLLYDFSAKRKNEKLIEPSTTSLFDKKYKDAGHLSEQDYLQFGGRVFILFDYLIPIFNIKKIISNENKTLLEVATVGKLENSNDNSFLNFCGFEASTTSGQKKSQQKNSVDKKLSEQKKAYSLPQKQNITLDANWTHSMENLWFLKDDALISLVQFSGDTEKNTMETLRRFMQSTQNSYAKFSDIDISKNENTYTVNLDFFQTISGKSTKNFRVITKRQNDNALLLLTVFSDSYKQNKNYFDNILKSYSAE